MNMFVCWWIPVFVPSVYTQRVPSLKHFITKLTIKLTLEVMNLKVLFHISDHESDFATNQTPNVSVQFLCVLQEEFFKEWITWNKTHVTVSSQVVSGVLDINPCTFFMWKFRFDFEEKTVLHTSQWVTPRWIPMWFNREFLFEYFLLQISQGNFLLVLCGIQTPESRMWVPHVSV